MSYRFAARSTTPGEWRFTPAAVLLLAVPPTRPTVDSRLTTVAKGLVQRLWLAGYAAERRFLPRRKIEEYAALRIAVIARSDGIDVTDGNRSARLRTYTLDVAYQQRLVETEAAAEEAELDAHEVAVQGIMDALDPINGATIEDAQITGVERYAGEEAPYSMKHLAELRLYTAVVKVTLEEYREAA